MTEQADLVTRSWERIRSHLESKKHSINQQITTYPTPIAGCDEQFNHLLRQQTEVSGELARLKEKESESLRARDAAAVVDEFLESATQIDPQEKESIRIYVGQGGSSRRSDHPQ